MSIRSLLDGHQSNPGAKVGTALPRPGLPRSAPSRLPWQKARTFLLPAFPFPVAGLSAVSSF